MSDQLETRLKFLVEARNVVLEEGTPQHRDGVERLWEDYNLQLKGTPEGAYLTALAVAAEDVVGGEAAFDLTIRNLELSQRVYEILKNP